MGGCGLTDVPEPPLSVVEATYRLQLHAGFTLLDACRLVPFLADLGVSHAYLSPIFVARPESTHGYDVVDPTRVNPELGGEAALDALTERLRSHEMGLILDLVPNHMAADHRNPWWMDVLTHGPASEYAHFFDIDWNSSQAPHGHVLLPFLGVSLEEALAAGEIQPVLERRPAGESPTDGEPLGLYARYHDRLLPLEPGTWPDILRSAKGPPPPALEHLAAALDTLPPFRSSGAAAAERRRRSAAAHDTLSRLAVADPAALDVLRRILADLAAAARDGVDTTLAAILARQPWILVHHGDTSRRLNYRRFFDISDLVGVRVEDDEVFAATHSLVFDLVERGAVDGVRVDHVDGLLDPTAYLHRLHDGLAERRGRPVPIWVEKILSPGEDLPPGWPVAGTTGYEFLNALNHVFVDAEGLDRLGRFYDGFTGRDESFDEIRHRCKRLALTELLGAETLRVGERLAALARKDRSAKNLRAPLMTEALIEMTASLPVYRTYTGRDGAVSARDRALIRAAFDDVERRRPGGLTAALAFLRRVLELQPDADGCPIPGALELVLSWQQLSGPAMAKGVEDTAFYRYNRLASLAEVGGEVSADPQAPARFHQHNQRMLVDRPDNLSTTTTHDTKRSEDARTRIDVLAECADAFAEAVAHWHEVTRPDPTGAAAIRAIGTRTRTGTGTGTVPDPNDEYLLYQAIVGTWPLRSEELPAFPGRVAEFLLKAVREAKENSSWSAPDSAYETALLEWAAALLTPQSDFLRSFLPFAERIAWYGALLSLGQVVAKVASPGVPDFYQGSYLWDLSLVDPDNRRPVDFDERSRMLAELRDAPDLPPARLAAGLLRDWSDGRLKLFVTMGALRARRAAPALFARGDYLPLEPEGRHADRVVAFARHHRGQWALAVFPRLPVALAPPHQAPIGRPVWFDTRVPLPPEAPREWRDVCVGNLVRANAGREGEGQRPGDEGPDRSRREGEAPAAAIFVGDALRHLPVALLRADDSSSSADVRATGASWVP